MLPTTYFGPERRPNAIMGISVNFSPGKSVSSEGLQSRVASGKSCGALMLLHIFAATDITVAQAGRSAGL